MALYAGIAVLIVICLPLALFILANILAGSWGVADDG